MRLIECFIEIFAFINDFRHTVEEKQPSFDEVKGGVGSLLNKSESHCAGEDFLEARFAVCAWVDEVVVSSCWEHKDLWLREQLQRAFYNTTDAGVEFFERLKGLGPKQREVREVYYFCLVLGFTGRYCNRGEKEELEQLKKENLEYLSCDAGGSPFDGAVLFPEAYPAAEQHARAKCGLHLPLGSIACLLAPVFLFVILFYVYRFSLRMMAADVIRAVAN